MSINRSYWRAREEAQRLLDMRSDAARERENSTLYKRAFDDIQKEIDAFYSRYATKEGISIAEAHKRVSRLDIEAYSRKAEAYVEEKNFTKQANEEMRLYNLAMKVNRLEMLKSKIALELAAKGSAEERHLKSTLDDAAKKELERLSGILGDTVKHDADPKQIQKIVEGDFHNATFSQRIWNNNKLLQLAIEKELQTSLVQGRRPDYKKMAQLFDASEYAAKRLLHTETKRVRTEAAKERYLENDIGEYEYMALGPNPCPICTELDGKHFPVRKMDAGENAPPMHPNCRCSTAPWVDEEAYNAWLDAKASGEFEGGFDESKNRNETPEFTPAKSLKEAEDYIKQYVDDSQFGALGVSYKGVSLDVANKINETLSKFFNKFDVGKFGGIVAPAGNTKLGKLISSATMAYSPIRNSILLNRSSLKDMKTAMSSFAAEATALNSLLSHPERYDWSKISRKAAATLERSRESGRATVPTTIEDALHHELGHMLEKRVRSSEDWNKVQANRSKYENKISGYAGHDDSEYIAESFASYMKGEKVIDPTLRKIFDGLRR